MCIRDRFSEEVKSGNVISGLEPLTGNDLVAFVYAGYYARPVSYTHLRAHETVLDLVCRLLLEKKNRHLYNTLHNCSA